MADLSIWKAPSSALCISMRCDLVVQLAFAVSGRISILSISRKSRARLLPLVSRVATAVA